MVREKELYLPILKLFNKDYFIADDVPLGPKRIDLVLMSKATGKTIAIEVKVKKWKQALRQALNYQLAADESYVAIYKRHSNSIDIDKFGKLGIGLIVIDSHGDAKITVPAKQSTRKRENYSTLMKAHLAERKATRTYAQNQKVISQSSLQQYLWYVATDRRYYDGFPHCYDGFIINAHVLAHYASAFTALCLRLNKAFFVVPDTHAFQLASITFFLDTKGGIRSSWEKLIDSYGPTVKLAMHQGRNLEPADFISSTGSWQQSLYDLVENAIAFQKNKVRLASSGLTRFFEGPTVTPTYVVAPYFFFTSVQDPWYKISVKMAEESAKYKGTHKLFALLCTSKSVIMSDQALSTIVDDYSRINLDGFLLWVQDFCEPSEPAPLLYRFRKLVEILKKNGRTVINLHGEFFSSLLHYYGLDGFSYGICYKASADPEEFPTGGPPGGPLPKYYFKELKIKMGKIEAAVAIQELPSLKCSCEICDGQIDSMLDAATPDSISRDLMKRHFLISRRQERDQISSHSLKKVLLELEKSYRNYEKRADIVPLEHLKRWIDVCKRK